MLAGAGGANAATVTEFSAGITPGSRPEGITAGPDGNLWFTEFNGGRVGRITPAGVVTEFSAGITPGSSPNGITAGPDGNLWFTEFNGGRVGRITPAGVVTEFPVAGVRNLVARHHRGTRRKSLVHRGQPHRADHSRGRRHRVLGRDQHG